MALNDSPLKSVGIIFGVALAGIIIVIATVTITNRRSTTTSQATNPFLESRSGVVFDVPADWTVSSTPATTLEVDAVRIEDIQTQRSTCTMASASLSGSLQALLTTGSPNATDTWLQQYAGIVPGQVLKGPSNKGTPTLFSIVGVDTCNPSLTVRTLTFRGQVYKNDVEVQISHQIEQSRNLSPTELNNIAQSLIDGTAADELQTPFNQFVAALGSVR